MHRKPNPLKLWFNHQWPLYRVCHRAWCFRGMTNDYRCSKHQEIGGIRNA